MPRLYVVATPIGNLSDISARALDILREADLIAAEDTRVTRAMLEHFGISTPCVSNHRHNEAQRAEPLVEKMLSQDLTVAVVTDAGTPCISDPGCVLVAQAAAAGIEVIAVPGPTAMASAISVSGFDAREFAFYGFLPRQKKELCEKLRAIARSGMPVAVVHESPHRVIDLLRAICETLPGCLVSASCDLTKLYEKTVRGEAEEVLLALLANPKVEKGEYCLVLELRGVRLEQEGTSASVSLEAQLLEQMLRGATLREAGERLTIGGAKRNDVYRARMNVQRFLGSLKQDGEQGD